MHSSLFKQTSQETRSHRRKTSTDDNITLFGEIISRNSKQTAQARQQTCIQLQTNGYFSVPKTIEKHVQIQGHDTTPASVLHSLPIYVWGLQQLLCR